VRFAPLRNPSIHPLEPPRVPQLTRHPDERVGISPRSTM
jgi:hypothetical protein